MCRHMCQTRSVRITPHLAINSCFSTSDMFDLFEIKPRLWLGLLKMAGSVSDHSEEILCAD